VTLDFGSARFVPGDSLVNYSVDWGDGSADNMITSTTLSHTYTEITGPTQKTYKIVVNTSLAADLEFTNNVLLQTD